MIEALQNVGMPLVVPANERSSVRACVQKNPQLAVAAADEEQRPPRHIPAPVVARLLDFGLMTQIEPAFVEYPLLLHPKNFERCHGGAVDSKYTLLRVVDDQIFSVEHRVPLVDTSTHEHPGYTTLEHQARKRLPPMGPLIHFMEPARAGVLSYSTV
jgi:hypothetical protein